MLDTDRGRFRADSLVVASGGLSIPKIGASPLGYRLAEQFAIPVLAPRPALVPLTLPPRPWPASRRSRGLPSTPSRAAAADVSARRRW